MGLMAILILLLVLICELVDGRRIIKASNNGVIKTIESDNGETIDCYNIYSQPALKDPRFRNHSIQIRRSSYPKGLPLTNLGTMNLTQSWHKHGTCPEETIPILRFSNNYNPKATLPRKHFSDSGDVYRKNNQDITNQHEYASIILQGDFRGAQAKINVWKPVTEPGEYSASLISVIAGNGAEVISVGWRVYPDVYGDSEPRFFVSWTADYYQSTGCHDIRCTGFVQTSPNISLGAAFNPISIFNGSQYDSAFAIIQDGSSGNWWIKYQDVDVGYFPPSLFNLLSTKATRVDFGGQITNTRHQGRHTSTGMGSGHLPAEGNFGISSYFQQVKVVDANHIARDPGNSPETKIALLYRTNPNCYGLDVGEYLQELGYNFYYGGPGYSNICQ